MRYSRSSRFGQCARLKDIDPSSPLMPRIFTPCLECRRSPCSGNVAVWKSRRDAVDEAFSIDYVQLAAEILAERRNVALVAELRQVVVLVDHTVVHIAKAPDPSATEVAVEVLTRENWELRSPIHIPTGDGTPLGVVVVEHREHESSLGAGRRVVTGEPFHDAPTVIPSPGTRRRLDVHFLSGCLADVGNVQVPRHPIERESPRVAQAVGPDLGFGGW